MKFSQLTTDESVSVLIEIAPLIENICNDDELVAEIRDRINADEYSSKAEIYHATLNKLTKLVPIVLKKRKADTFGIIAALNGKTVEEVGKQNLLVTIGQIREMVKDKELIDFFHSCMG